MARCTINICLLVDTVEFQRYNFFANYPLKNWIENNPFEGKRHCPLFSLPPSLATNVCQCKLVVQNWNLRGRLETAGRGILSSSRTGQKRGGKQLFWKRLLIKVPLFHPVAFYEGSATGRRSISSLPDQKWWPLLEPTTKMLVGDSRVKSRAWKRRCQQKSRQRHHLPHPLLVVRPSEKRRREIFGFCYFAFFLTFSSALVFFFRCTT